MKKTALLFLCAATLLLAACGGKKGGNAAPAEETAAAESAPAAQDTLEPLTDLTMQYEPAFKIETSEGDLFIKLYEETPLHKDNFIKLVKEHFYDGILFHRVINGFMIQVGDPLTKESGQENNWGSGGPGYTVPAEIVKGFTHKKGALAAARRADRVNPSRASSGSQFYIVQDENGCRHLDGQYTVFGEVTRGLDVLDRIAAKPTDAYDRPVDSVKIISITPITE